MRQIVYTEHPVATTQRTLRAFAVAILVSTAFWSSSVVAEEEARSADVAAAREIAIEGLKLADAGQCGQAIDRLSRAEKLHHAPIVLGRLGECEIAEGRLVDGTEDLRRLLREPLPANPPAALLKARERAQAALDSAKSRIAFLSISVREPASDVTVTVDGQLVPVALFDRGRPTDPGEHVVEASAPGFVKATRQVTLGPGEKQDMSFKLVADPQAAIVAKDTPLADAATQSQTQPLRREPNAGKTSQSSANVMTEVDSPSYAASYVLWSLGTASAAVGGVFGYLALKQKSDLDGQCANGICPVTSASQLESAKRDALVSTILLGTGGAALAIGTITYLLTGPSAEQPAAAVTARPVLGVGQLGLQGTF